MATRFVSIDRETPLLLPPDVRDWVPASHLERCSDVVASHYCSSKQASRRLARDRAVSQDFEMRIPPKTRSVRNAQPPCGSFL